VEPTGRKKLQPAYKDLAGSVCQRDFFKSYAQGDPKREKRVW